MVSDGISTPAIAVDRLEKSFRVAKQRSESSRLRLLGGRFETLEVLRGVSFTVEPGELFGVMGRNGSGKSTLLKIISGVYPADAGSVHVEGRLAPALELGVGFSPELSSSENAAINGVMLGLSRRDARRRVSSILDFADLQEFSETRLKDLSSGMRMRLAFAALIETDPDVLLVDEILAVGDRAFQEKCTEAFAAFRKRGRTIILVTHATGLIERLCDRALLLENGLVETVGDPGEVAARYIEVNLPEGADEAEMIDDGDERRKAIQITETVVSAAAGWERTSAGAGLDREIVIEATLEVLRPVEHPGLRIEIRNERGGRVFRSPTIPLAPLSPGEGGHVRAWTENRLHPGDYSLSLAVVRPGKHGKDVPASPVAQLPLRIPGDARSGGGAVALRHGATIERFPQGAEVAAG
jgi:ABC-2 type transport system ATP-binding protein